MTPPILADIICEQPLKAPREGEAVPKLDQVDRMEGDDDAQVQDHGAQTPDHGSDTKEEPAELIGDERMTACWELIGDGRRYGKDIQVKRDFKADTGD